MTAATIKDWLVEQTSYDYRPDAETIRVVRDPEVAGTWAVRFIDYRTEATVDLLFVTGGEEGTDAEVLEATLEEVEYTTWPPASGGLRFF